MSKFVRYGSGEFLYLLVLQVTGQKVVVVGIPVISEVIFRSFLSAPMISPASGYLDRSMWAVVRM